MPCIFSTLRYWLFYPRCPMSSFTIGHLRPVADSECLQTRASLLEMPRDRGEIRSRVDASHAASKGQVRSVISLQPRPSAATIAFRDVLGGCDSIGPVRIQERRVATTAWQPAKNRSGTEEQAANCNSGRTVENSSPQLCFHEAALYLNAERTNPQPEFLLPKQVHFDFDLAEARRATNPVDWRDWSFAP